MVAKESGSSVVREDVVASERENGGGGKGGCSGHRGKVMKVRDTVSQGWRK